MRMPLTRHRQKGWTLWGLAVVILLIAFFSLIGMKLFPAYMTNMKLSRALTKIATEPDVGGQTKREIISRLEKMLYIDYADEDINLKEALTIDKGKYGMTLILHYETKVHLVYNVSALIEFHNSAKVN